jgi:DNA polymerase-3 subunit gamma/tau
MSYQVLARKWRPRLFGELVGQEHVVRALTNALDHDRLHHAYLFTGTRGVGKTTLARIFSKSLNCEQGVGSVPCGQCSSCREIDEGRFVDLLEVDAASRTKVDQTRELLENVPYAPVRGRYKVYIIDEVHMFSDSSFNALLKTLEEPPPHVKFLLATTDPQKVPMTVLSRCLQFNLKRLTREQIRGHLEKVLSKESIPCDAGALMLLAQAADGSIRDALSLMDQAIAFGGGQVMEPEVRSMLGTVAGEQVHRLLDLLAQGDARQVMEAVAELAERVPDFAGVLQELLALLHRVALCQAVPDLVGDGAGDAEQIHALAGQLQPEDLQLFYQIGLIGQRDLPLAPDPRSGFEMVLLRMLAFKPERTDAGAEGQGGNGGKAAPRPRLQTPQPQRTKTAPVRMEKPTAASSKPVKPVKTADKTAQPREGAAADLSQWHQVVAELDLGGISRQLADNCLFGSWDGKRVVLTLDPAHKHLQVESSVQRLRRGLEAYLNSDIVLDIQVEAPTSETPAQRQSRARGERQQEAEAAMAVDPVVKMMEERFDAHLVPGSIKPIDE